MSVGPPIITLLTDFGSSDTYVGQMKGAILSVCRTVQLIDLTHHNPPGDVSAASLAWDDVVSAFPAGTIHVGVVDPGVGSERRAIAVEVGEWKFICPDNGLITRILQHWPLKRAVELRNPAFWRTDVSPVFHGRDLFGPVAGHWAAGRDLSEFGPAIDGPLIRLSSPEPNVTEQGIHGVIVSVDRFGNLRTNIPAAMLPNPPANLIFEVSRRTIRGLSNYFGEACPGMPLAIIGSHGCLEIAVNQDSAAVRLKCSVGDEVRVSQSPS